MDQTQIEKLKAALRDIGIRTDKDLQEAIRNLPPLKLHIMTGQVPAGKGKTNEEICCHG